MNDKPNLPTLNPLPYCSMPPKKRKHAEVHGPDAPTARLAPGFETKPEINTLFERHIDYVKTSEGLAGSSSMIEGPFSPQKKAGHATAPLETPSPPSDTSLPFVEAVHDTTASPPADSTLPAKRPLVLEGIWDCDDSEIDSDDETGIVPLDKKGKSAHQKKKRKTTQAVSLSICSSFIIPNISLYHIRIILRRSS